MKPFIHTALNTLYPRRCPLCHRILKNQRDLICPQCRQELRPITGARCMKCGKPVREDEEYCAECLERPRMFTQGKGIFLYDEKWKTSLEKYKYYGCREYGDFYAQAMYLFAGEDLRRWKPDLIVSVPLHPRKKRTRGFNQAQYLAERIGRNLGVPAAENLVRKVRTTKSQKKLNAEERRRNLKGAFAVEERLDGLRILVIDDVYTTGSTMDEMASCLCGSGAEKVYFLTVCTGA